MTRAKTDAGCYLTKLKVKNLKDSEEGLIVNLKGERVSLGVNENGDPVSGLVFRAIAKEEFEKLTKSGVVAAIAGRDPRAELECKPDVERTSGAISGRVGAMRANLISVLALGLLTAACGSNEAQRAATGGLTGLGAGALIGGPIGAVVGGAVGAAAGSALPEGADTLTARALHKERGMAANALSDAGLGTRSDSSQTAAAQGQSSRLIRDAQAELQREGLYKGRVDGIDGPLTQQAVRGYQQREGLQQTAVLDQPTLERMNLAGEAQTAQRNGRTETTGSGTSSAPAALNANEIRSRLEQAGYSNVRDIRREANIYTARAEQGDTHYRIRVDARTGQVLSQHRLAPSQQSGAAAGAASIPGAAQTPSATLAGGKEANPNGPVPPNAPGAVGSNNANAGADSGTSMPRSTAAAPGSAASVGSSALSESPAPAASGPSRHGGDTTPPTPDQQSGAGNTTSSNPSR